MVGEQRYSSWILERTAIGETHRLRLGINSVGRHSSSQVRILDSHYVSRHHAEVEVSQDDGAVSIKDLNSVNGIFVNNVLHKSAIVALSSGDHIGIGVSIDCSEDEDELTLPIYELKYAPITRGKQSAVSAHKSAGPGNPLKREEKVTPSTSRQAASVSSKQHIADEILIISDDEEVDVAGGSGCNNEKIAGIKQTAKQITSTLNIPIVGITIKKEKLENEQPTKMDEDNIKEKIFSGDHKKSLPSCLNVVEKSLSKTRTEIDKEEGEKASLVPANITDKDQMKSHMPENTIEPCIHIPIISNIKKERILSVSADVQHIFGDLDDDEKDKLKEINPLVYNSLSGKPLLPLANVDNNSPLLDGASITLLSDDEELGVIIPNTVPNVSNANVKSPNIFDTSLNDSIEDHSVKALETLKNHLNEETAKDKQLPTDNIDLEDYTSYVPHSDDEDVEDYMFSQVLINDMKAELQDDFNKDLEEDLPQADNSKSEQLCIQIKQELDLERNSTLLNDIGNSTWVISDDEDYDEELETKVADWSNKIFSQSYNCNNMSQVFDFSDNLSDHDDEDDKDVESNGEHDPAYLEIVDDDIDNIANLYNSNNDIQGLAMPEIKKGIQTADESLKAAKDNEQETKPNEQTLETKDRIITTSDDTKEKSEKGALSTAHRTETSSNLEQYFESLKNFGSSSGNKEKSPIPSTLADTDSPLIRSRRKSSASSKRGALSSASEDELDNQVVQEKPQTTKSKEQQQHKENVAKSITRPPPTIIDAPSLPKCKGKLRGVSAEKSPHSVKHKKLPSVSHKLETIKEQLRFENINKELKRKWTEKPSVKKIRDKERMNIIKECRKDKLKKLAEKHVGPAKDNVLKRKKSTDVDEETKAKKAKVKVTQHNRGAFLAQDETKPHPSKDNKSNTFKIPKVINKKPDEQNKESPHHSNSSDERKEKEPLKRSTSIDSGFPTFSQELSKPDQLLAKKVENKSNCPGKRPITSRRDSVTGTGTVCKEAVAARALRTTNKITFASMEKNINQSEMNKNKLNSICNQRSSISKIDNPKSIISPSKSANVVGVKKKTVRFNDIPVIHYIERVYGARKVVAKDILPLSTHKDRRQIIRRTYPIIDNTDKIISQILCWSDEWLIKRNAAVDAASEVVYPMPTHFSSFDHYKSIMFPLMKLEFVSLLERQYNLTTNIKKYRVTLEYVTVNTDRLMLVTKFSCQNREQLDSCKYDLVLMESERMNTEMFAYLTSIRKGAGSCNTMVFEIIPKNITKEFFSGIKELTIRPVIDNVRVEFGAFNAVYQLEATPLFQKILNPMELLQCRHPARKKVIYRGFDPLNDKQRQVLLNTYVRIIDETTPNVSLLQGPPGTGKSCVITNLALQTMYGDEVRCMDKKILICAQSNAAVDVIAGKLYDISMRMRPEKRFRLIRYGLQEKINPFVYPVTLQNIIEQEKMKKLKSTNPNISLENKENLKTQMLQLEAQIANMSNRNIKGTFEEDLLMEKERQLKLMRNILNQFSRPEDERSLATWCLNNANIVCATLSSCVKLIQYVNYFDICIVDEATQCTEPWTLLPLRFGINSLVLVGDTQQLPATILSKKANELGLGKSMFTRIQNCLDNVSCNNITAANSGVVTPNYIISGLQTQYRMQAEICRWPNQYFYRNELINGRITLEYKTPLMPFSVLNLSYTQNEFCGNGKITNNLEAEFVAKLLKALDGYIPNKYNSYGVITPYAHHRSTLEQSIRSLGLTNIMVNTIDSYQGLEKDVIVISNARTNGIGFLANPQRLNVALTRPKKCLILCGNFKNLEIVPAWRSLLQSARERNLYHEISPDCVTDMHSNVIDKIKIKK